MDIKETDLRFIFLRTKVFLFLLMSIGAMILFLYFVGVQRGIFTKKQEFYCLTSKANGMYIGMPVKVSGFKIGRVKDMQLEDSGLVKLTLSVEQNQSKWFRQGTLALLTKEGFIGETYIDILPGDGKPLKPHQTIKFIKQASLDEIANRLSSEISQALKGINKTIDYINEPQGSVKRSLKNIEKTSQNLIDITNNLNKLIDELNKETPKISNKSQQTLDEITKLAKSLQDLTIKLNKSAEQINKATKDDLPIILEQTNKSLQDVDDILQSVKGLWPIREGIKKQAIKPIEADSYERNLDK